MGYWIVRLLTETAWPVSTTSAGGTFDRVIVEVVVLVAGAVDDRRRAGVGFP